MNCTLKTSTCKITLASEIFSSQEYQTSKFQKTDMFIEFSMLDLAKNSPFVIVFQSISLFFCKLHHQLIHRLLSMFQF